MKANTYKRVNELMVATAATNTLVLAEYEYTPFGEVRMMSGEYANKNPIRFSTRYAEPNVDLSYYSYRHYSPRLKKWLSKDPIGESGGENLYQVCHNIPVGWIDNLGYNSQPCRIDIYLAHGGDYGQRKGNIKTDLEKVLNNAVRDAQTKGYHPSGYAVGGTGCSANLINRFYAPSGEGKFGYPNPMRPDHSPYLLSIVSYFLETEIQAAKSYARANMCNKEPACCTSIYIQILPIGDDFIYAQNVYMWMNPIRSIIYLYKYTSELTVNCN